MTQMIQIRYSKNLKAGELKDNLPKAVKIAVVTCMT